MEWEFRNLKKRTAILKVKSSYLDAAEQFPNLKYKPFPHSDTTTLLLIKHPKMYFAIDLELTFCV